MSGRDPTRATAVAAQSLAAPLADLRDATTTGTVLATFGRSAYLDLEGRVVALVSADLGHGPFTMRLRDLSTDLPITRGDPAALRAGQLHLGSLTVDLGAAAIWDPSLPLLGNGHGIPPSASWGDLHAVVVEQLVAGAPADSVVALLDVKRPAHPAPLQRALIASLRHGLNAIDDFLAGRIDGGALTRAGATEIAGRGHGLTPSGDDLLVGIMHATTLWPAITGTVPAGDLRRVLADAVIPNTTRISAAYLDAAARGWASEPWHAMVQSLSRSPGSTRAAVRRLLRVGETSGADALTGFCWAWKHLC